MNNERNYDDVYVNALARAHEFAHSTIEHISKVISDKKEYGGERVKNIKNTLRTYNQFVDEFNKEIERTDPKSNSGFIKELEAL